MTDADERLYRRANYVPRAIENTLDKLERLFAEAEPMRLPDVVTWRERMDELRSTYLTDKTLVNAAWERMVKEARS